MVQRVLVTGANGFIGRHAVAAFAAAGWAVRGAVRTPVELPDAEVFVSGDLSGNVDWSRMLDGVDVVVHLAARVHRTNDELSTAAYDALNVVATERLALQCVAAGVRRIVFASSAAVHGEGGGAGAVRESDPLDPRTAYARSKCRAEAVLQAVTGGTGTNVVSLRPPMVYGPGNPGNLPRLMWLVRRRWPLPLGSVDNRRSFVFVANLADAMVRCATALKPAAVYLIADGEPVSTPRLVEALSREITGEGGRLFRFPVSLLVALGDLIGRGGDVRRVTGSFVVDDSAIRRDLSWVPPYRFEEGIRETARWFAERAA